MRKPNGQRLCQLSGGFDSAAAMLWSLSKGPTVGIFIDYNQGYLKQEQIGVRYLTEEAEAVAGHKNFQGLIEVALNLGFKDGTPYVPHRNLVLTAISANWALANNMS